VNKKSLESLAYSGTFDCFPEYHRAQYFTIADGDRISGLEKLIGYAQALQSMTAGTTNTLFGDLPSAMQVPVPKIPVCEEWTLTEKLEHEKDITGMFMSGHPLDHYGFEMRHYQFTPINAFNEVKDNISMGTAKDDKLSYILNNHILIDAYAFAEIFKNTAKVSPFYDILESEYKLEPIQGIKGTKLTSSTTRYGWGIQDPEMEIPTYSKFGNLVMLLNMVNPIW